MKMNEKVKNILINCIWFVFAYVFVVLIFRYFFLLVRVDGDSMLPTYSSGDLLLAVRTNEDICPDDVIIFGSDDGETRIKRVIRQEGQTVDMIDGDVYVDGKEVDDDFNTVTTANALNIPHTVEDNSYFVLGDNRLVSYDSRYFGDVETDEIRGKVITKLF